MGLDQRNKIKYGDGAMQYQLYILSLILLQELGETTKYRNGLKNLSLFSGNSEKHILSDISEMRSYLPQKVQTPATIADRLFK